MRDLPRGTQGHGTGVGSLSLTGLSPSTAGLSMPLLLANPICNSLRAVQCTAGRPYNTPTATAATYRAARVWAPPLSLATTNGMSVYSSRYLAVSVTSVSSSDLCFQSIVHVLYHVLVSLS